MFVSCLINAHSQLNKLDGVKTEHTAVDSVSSVVSEARKGNPFAPSFYVDRSPLLPVIVLSMLNQFAPATISTKVGMPVIATSRIAGVSTGAIGRVIGYTASLVRSVTVFFLVCISSTQREHRNVRIQWCRLKHTVNSR